MDKQLIINVGRQVGSGGLIIAKMLAKAFDCKFYDKEILNLAAQESGFSEKFFEKNDETKEYFQKHGGYENATKVTMTKWDPKPVKQSISTSGTSQSGTIVSENASGATVDIGGIIYIVHASKGFAFASEAVNTAVAGKDIVMPDYINYKGKRIPVTEMRGDIFWGKPIKSIKLPSTLTEISNAALRERKP